MIRIYVMNTELLRDAELYERLLCRCSPYRRGKVEACADAKERRSRLAASALLDLALRTRGLREQTAEYEIAEAGKPAVRGLDDFHFSISHSGCCAICAVSERPIGADLQESRPVSERLRKRVFPEGELACVDPIRLWTLKESYAKLTGEGIPVMERTELRLAETPIIYRDGVLQPVFFWETELENGSHLVTCGYENPSYSIELIEVNRSDLN